MRDDVDGWEPGEADLIDCMIMSGVSDNAQAYGRVT